MTEKEIGNVLAKYMPRLLEEGIEVELKELSIQELIALQAKALETPAISIGVDVKDTTNNYENTAMKIRDMINDKIMDAESLYILTNQATNMPYIDDNDSIYVFSQEQFAIDAADFFAQQYRVFGIHKVEKENIKLAFRVMHQMAGVKNILVDNGKTWIIIPLEKLLGKQNFAGTEPIANPGLLLAATKLEQERRWPLNYQQKGKKLRDYEDKFLDELMVAKFIIPTKEVVNDENGTRFDVPTLDGSDGSKALPVFTDYNQLMLMFPDVKMNSMVLDVDGLLNAPLDVVVLNPSELSLAIGIPTLKEIINERKNAEMHAN